MRLSKGIFFSVLAAGFLFFYLSEATQVFTNDPNNLWNVNTTSWQTHPNSTVIMSFIVNSGGFDASTGALRIDFGMVVNHAYSSTPRYPLQPTSDYDNDECVDSITFATDYTGFPLPADGGVEGSYSPGYSGCSGDCHVLVVDHDANLIYEAFHSDFDGTHFIAQCVIVWNMCGVYGLAGRGEQCTSTDAGGLSVTAGVVQQSEVVNNNLNHALRFILANSQIGTGPGGSAYVHPANHVGGPESNSPAAPLYGARFRLKPGFNLAGLPASVQVIGQALKTYGAILTDGDDTPAFSLSFQLDGYDPLTNATWDSLGISQQVLSQHGIDASVFEVVVPPDYPTVIEYTGDCVKLPIPTTTCATSSASGGTASGGSASGGSASGGSASGKGTSSSANSLAANNFWFSLYSLFA